MKKDRIPLINEKTCALKMNEWKSSNYWSTGIPARAGLDMCKMEDSYL